MYLDIKVKGMMCANCEKVIKNALMKIKLVKDVKANFETGIVKVIFKDTITEDVKNQVMQTIVNLDYVIDR